MILSIGLIIVGIIYIIKPDSYKGYFVKEKNASQEAFFAKKYVLLMRILGTVFIIIGIITLLKYI
jgi:Tfp pilus assembly protein PilE